MNRAQIITESVTHDVAFCQCGGFLEFTTNLFGGVVERCTRCKRQGPMQKAPAREITPERQWRGRRQAGPPCVDCGRPTVELHGGRHTARCYSCRAEHNKAVAREGQRRRRGAA